MADATPDYFVEHQRLKVQIASLKTNLDRSILEIMEIDFRRKKAVTNIESTRVAIAETEDSLASIVDAHGEAPALEL